MSEKKRAVRLLESQVTRRKSVDLREQELSKNFGSRVVVPVVAKAGRIARRVTPLDTRDRVAKKLLLAGSPAGWDAERVMAFKIIGAVAGAIGRFRVRRAGQAGSAHRDRRDRPARRSWGSCCPTPS